MSNNQVMHRNVKNVSTYVKIYFLDVYFIRIISSYMLVLSVHNNCRLNKDEKQYKTY